MDRDGRRVTCTPATRDAVLQGAPETGPREYVVLQYITPVFDLEKNTQYFATMQYDVTREKEIRILSQTDALTGVYNRLKFNQEMEREFARSRRYQSSRSLILFDIDHFKQVNETFRHNTGDEILKSLVGLAEAILRDTDIFCRWGGEEFVLLCPNTDDKEIRTLTERVRHAIESHHFETAERITISLGTGSFHRETDTAESLMHRVDNAVYDAKRRGRHRAVSD
jgi:diguanylate cyclase (GGDEF)-like protein